MQGYAQSGKPADLLERYGLTSRGVQNAVLKVLKRK
jgi:transketolase C-terminal domain/subunit